MFKTNALAVGLLLVYVRVALSINCYECNSVNNSMCLDPSIYDQETLARFLPIAACGSAIQAVDQQEFFCRKIVQSILNKGYQPDVRVTRTCGWVRHHKSCYKADNEDHLETVCQCFSDGCNGSAGIKSMVMLVAAAALFKTVI